MRSGTTAPVSKIPLSCGRGTAAASGIGLGARGVATPSSSKAPSAAGLPASKLPVQPKFQPFKKPAAVADTASDALPAPLPEVQAPVPSLATIADADVGPQVAGPAFSPDTQQARSSSSPQRHARSAAADEDKPECSECGSTPDYPDAPVVKKADGSQTTKVSPEVNGPISSRAADVPTGAVQTAPAGAKQQDKGSKGQPLQQRLEKVLREAGVSTARPDGLQAVAAAIVEAVQAESATAAKAATASGRLWSRLAWIIAIVGLICLGGLALGLAWVVWVLMQRNIVGSPELTRWQDVGYFF